VDEYIETVSATSDDDMVMDLVNSVWTSHWLVLVQVLGFISNSQQTSNSNSPCNTLDGYHYFVQQSQMFQGRVFHNSRFLYNFCIHHLPKLYYCSGETTRTTPRKGKYDSDMVSAAIPTVDDRDQQNEKRSKAAEYQKELERQVSKRSISSVLHSCWVKRGESTLFFSQGKNI
jgi:hypothetical protein